ncbi:hypothetical protein [Saccharolobus shibatae]|uniref:Uncharacterized protein n=1 Tax=Saccharolobus shibatae TaxID=2286 RepID=A0A8F5C138_9CREN|nr:hypothetical protein [Saccharolobus shibatae]QXJ35127.1 hypothetical protein J5U22_01674 [Saccharolobus shibatae]
MSASRSPHQGVSISIRNMQPMEIVKAVLESNYRYFYNQIKSETSYRKIHEILATILDTAEGMSPNDAISFLKKQLPRVYVIIEYQNARGQIYNGLRDLLINVIDELSSANASNIKNLIRNARLLIDSLAVIAKEVG